AAEALLPLAVAEHADQLLARTLIFVRQEAAADQRSRAEDREVVAADDLAEHLLRLAAAAGDVERNALVRRDVGEHLVLLAQIAIVRRRALQESAAPERVLVPLVAGEHRDQLRRILDRQRMQQHRIDQREDRRVRADAERQRQRRDRRER